MLRRSPPAPFTFWRFTTTALEIAGTPLPARSPVLVDIRGINGSVGQGGADLSFGAGPHYCVGARLALGELCAVVEVFRSRFPGARLAVPFAEPRQVGRGGIDGSRLTGLPVNLDG